MIPVPKSMTRALALLALTLAVACGGDTSGPGDGGDDGDGGDRPAPGRPGAFDLRVSRDTITVEAGTSGTRTVRVSRDSGFTGAVELRATGLPAGITATFSPSTLDSGETQATVTFAVGADVEEGRTTITLVGEDGSGAGKTAEVELLVPIEWASVSASWDATCGLTRAGRAYCWGDIDLAGGGTPYEELGQGAPIDDRRDRPHPVSGDLRFKRLAVGINHVCGITTGGAAYCWGFSGFGQIGDGTDYDGYGDAGDVYKPVPVAVSGGLKWRSIDLDQSLTCGVAETGEAYCWGLGYFGGEGTERAVTPRRVDAPFTYSEISVGIENVCGVTTAGTIRCWGRSDYGQLGNGEWPRYSSTPAEVLGGPYVDVATGSYHSCARTPGRTLYCWGGALAIGTPVPPRPDYSGEPFSEWPRLVEGGDWRQVVTGNAHTCALDGAGAAYCWGLNEHGRLGDGTTTTRLTPTRVATSLTFTSLGTSSSGTGTTCGVTTEGRLYCWGRIFDLTQTATNGIRWPVGPTKIDEPL